MGYFRLHLKRAKCIKAVVNFEVLKYHPAANNFCVNGCDWSLIWKTRVWWFRSWISGKEYFMQHKKG